MDYLRTIARLLLAAFLIAAGTAHFVVPAAFLAQVPPWLPLAGPAVVVSGVIEILLGLALATTRSPRRRQLLGRGVAAFFAIVWVGNISQAVTGTPGFGLTSDEARWVRAAMQPVLIAWALWTTSSFPTNPGSPIRTGRVGPDDRPAPPPTHEQ